MTHRSPVGPPKVSSSILTSVALISLSGSFAARSVRKAATSELSRLLITSAHRSLARTEGPGRPSPEAAPTPTLPIRRRGSGDAPSPAVHKVRPVRGGKRSAGPMAARSKISSGRVRAAGSSSWAPRSSRRSATSSLAPLRGLLWSFFSTRARTYGSGSLTTSALKTAKRSHMKRHPEPIDGFTLAAHLAYRHLRMRSKAALTGTHETLLIAGSR
jgi:hypothetical protein